MKILITPKSFMAKKSEAQELFENRNVELIFNETGKTYTEQEMVSKCLDVDGVIVGIDPITSNVLKGAKKLKAISKYGVGLDNIDLECAKKLNIEVKRADGANSRGVAELAIALMFNISRNIYPAVLSVKSNRWDRKIGREVQNKTAGILGLGEIGREVAKMCNGLSMDILAYDPYFTNEKFIEENNIKMASLDKIYMNSDYLFLHMPLTEETKKIINLKTLKKMKKTCYIINTSRGELVNEDDLYEALINNLIAGTASDVFSCEPAGEHPLVNLDNFLLTPHIGAFTQESTQKMMEISIKNLKEMLF